jgi:hypothetical protein
LVEMPVPVLSLAESRSSANSRPYDHHGESAQFTRRAAISGARRVRAGWVWGEAATGGEAGAGFPRGEAVIPPAEAAAAPRGFWFNVNAELIVYAPPSRMRR